MWEDFGPERLLTLILFFLAVSLLVHPAESSDRE